VPTDRRTALAEGHHRRARAGPVVLLEAATIYRKLKRYDEEAALIRRFARNYDNSFQGIFAALSSEIRRPRGLGRKISGTPG
jgi:hypothetical protein